MYQMCTKINKTGSVKLQLVGSVVVCRTWSLNREVLGFNPRHILPITLINTQEALALSLLDDDSKIVDWDVKPQNKQCSCYHCCFLLL